MTARITEREQLGMLIGWTRSDSKIYGWITPPPPRREGSQVEPKGYHDAISGMTIRFNPFENAEDDNDLLEWAKSIILTNDDNFLNLIAEFGYVTVMNYQIGDYAKAILKAEARR